MKGKKVFAIVTSMFVLASAVLGCGNTGGNAAQGNAEKENLTQTQGTESAETQSENVSEETSGVTDTVTENIETSTLSDNPMEMITQGYYALTYAVEGMEDMVCYFHFYEEQPVIGNVFFAGFAWNQVTFAGTYTVEEKETAYACFDDREASIAEGGVPTEGTAPYTVTFYDFAGNELDSCGFDGKILYNDMTTISGPGDGNILYHLDADGETSKYYETFSQEPGIVYLDLVAEDPTSTLALYHNGTYMDLVNMMVEGTWSAAETENGFEYTLTPSTEGDTPAVLTVSADMAVAEYIPDGGDVVAMSNRAVASQDGETPVMLLTGNMEVTEGVTADIVGSMYADGTVTLKMSAFGNEIDLDTGTYVMGEDGFTVTFQFDMAGEIISELGEVGATIQYVQAGTMAGDVDTQLTISLAE